MFYSVVVTCDLLHASWYISTACAFVLYVQLLILHMHATERIWSLLG